MARKKYEDMDQAELEGLIKWMLDKVGYMKYLLISKFGKQL